MLHLPIPDPGPGKYANEVMIRHMIEDHAAYSESGKIFDPKGQYLCGSCSMRVLPNRCTVVGEVPISMQHGGCRRWEGGEPMGKEHPEKSKPASVGYGERTDGFSCKRCEYAVKAEVADGKRTLWCGFWGLRVLPNACCDENDGADLKEPYLVQIIGIKQAE